MIGPAAGVALYQFSPPVLWVTVFMVSTLAAGAVLTLAPVSEGETRGVGRARPLPEGDS